MSCFECCWSSIDEDALVSAVDVVDIGDEDRDDDSLSKKNRRSIRFVSLIFVKKIKFKREKWESKEENRMYLITIKKMKYE